MHGDQLNLQVTEETGVIACFINISIVIEPMIFLLFLVLIKNLPSYTFEKYFITN